MKLPFLSGSRKTTALIVEDELPVLEMLAMALEEEGFETLRAGSGAEALVLSRKVPDIILLDMNLGDSDGIEILQRLKTVGETKGIPVIMVTGRQTGADVEKAFAYGACGYVIKPFDLPRVIDKIREAVAAQK